MMRRAQALFTLARCGLSSRRARDSKFRSDAAARFGAGRGRIRAGENGHRESHSARSGAGSASDVDRRALLLL